MTGDAPDSAGRLAALLREVAGEIDAMEGSQGWLAALRFGVAGGLADLGDPDAADAGFRRILEGTPTHLWAWIGRIGIAMGRGDAATAAALGREAMGHLPTEALLCRKTAEAVEAAEGPGAALAILRSRPVEAMTAGDLGYAIGLHRAAGRVPEAGDLCARLIALMPEAAIAHLARIEIGLVTGDAIAAVEAAEAALVHNAGHAEIVLRAAQAHRLAGAVDRATELARNAPEDARFAPSLLMLRAELAEMAGEVGAARAFWAEVKALALPEVMEAAEAALERLVEGPPQEVPDPPADARPEPGVPEDADGAALHAALEAALSGGAETGEVEALLARLIARRDLPWYLALRLVERVWRAGAAAEAAGLAAALDSADWPEADRQAFAIEDRLLRDGPHAALAWVRDHRVARRDAEACERLGRVLSAAGTGALAARYLRACCRRWPGDGAFLRQAARAMIACGKAGAVEALVEGMGASAPAADRLDCRVEAALAMGRPDAVIAACRDAEDGGPVAPPLVALIEAQVLAGDLPGAEASLARLSVEDGPVEEALICRPRATRVGSLLNEARILAAMGVADEDGGHAALAGDFFLAARGVVLARSGERNPEGVAGAIPDKLHLVWRGPAPQPAAMERLLAAWRGATARDVQVHDPQSWASWLRERIGADAARAHAMAADAEQKGDLMALALLMAEGGMALAAEQMPTGDVDLLCDAGGGATVFLEGTGGLSMDAVIAPPAHPLVAMALDMVIAACLARENDHRWFKTGPGMMARALARCLGEADPEACPVSVVPAQRLRRVVHPCRPAFAPPRAPRDAGGVALREAARRVLEP